MYIKITINIYALAAVVWAIVFVVAATRHIVPTTFQYCFVTGLLAFNYVAMAFNSHE